MPRNFVELTSTSDCPKVFCYKMNPGHWLLILYVVLLPIIIVVLLCGEKRTFEGTIVQRAHYWITSGSCDCFQKLVGLVFGERGTRACTSLEHACCERPNPALQLFYLAIIIGSYYTFISTSFKFIPGYYVPSIHKYTGTAAVSFGVVIFLVTSFSDPGTITSANLAQHKSTYAYDNIIYEEKTCTTCKISRPARSKHCSICDRCIARFDHHCGWMNNCIGENNLRYFLSFLLWHSLLCWYGVYVLVAILAGEVHDRRVVDSIKFYFGGNVPVRELVLHVSQWLLAFYSTQLLLMLFLTVVSFLLIGFLGYHLYLVATNTTTNESFKWEQYLSYMEHLASQDEALASKDVSSSGRSKCGWLCVGRMKKTPASVKKNNIYNRGIRRNFVEAMLPHWKSSFRGGSKKKK